MVYKELAEQILDLYTLEEILDDNDLQLVVVVATLIELGLIKIPEVLEGTFANNDV